MSAITNKEFANLCKLSYKDPNMLSYSNINCYNSSKFISNIETDAQCYIHTYLNNVYIVFRGTTSIEDWKHDVDTRSRKLFENVKVHNGFYEQYNSIKNEIYRSIPFIGNRNLYIMGHSLGGALAYVCAVDIYSTTYNKNINVFTIGSPRPGNKDFANYFNKNVKSSVRFKNKGDIITKLPLKTKYKHCHKSICIENGKIAKDVVYQTFFMRLFNTICRMNIRNLITNHSVDIYIDNIKQYSENK